MFLVVLWLVFSILVGLVASSKGRSGLMFFFVSIIFSPLIGLIIVFVLPKNNEIIDERAIENGNMKVCPNCAELVKKEAGLCKHCQSDLNIPPLS